MIDMSMISLAMSILKEVLGLPLVQKAIDNFTQGTANQIDDMVWAAVKRALELKLAPDLAKSDVINSLKSIQYKYDRMTPEEKWEAKKPRFAWTSDEAGRFVFTTKEV
jgi:hypothetical protein